MAEQNGGSMPRGHGGAGFGFGPGMGGGGGGHGGMSPEEAQAFFSMFFGGNDPFGGGGRRGHDPLGSMFGNGTSGGFSGIPRGMQTGAMPGMSFGARRRPSPPRYDAIPDGTPCSLKGLVNASHLNGDRGEVVQFIPSTGRYMVQLEETEETISVKPTNILQHVRVKMHDIQTKAELNGKTGTVLAWNNSKGRYNIYVPTIKQVVSLKPANVILHTGTVGQITGLSSKPELNGTWGTIKGWVRDSNKYDLQLSAQKIIRIKVDNLRV